MHNQEKHPVDELFARRLREVERMPSSQAWEELQNRLTKKKESKNGIYWTVAASVAILLGCFVGAVYWKPDAQLATTEPKKEQPVSIKPNTVDTEQTQPAPVATATPDKPETLTPPTKPVQAKTVIDNQPTHIAQNQPKAAVTTKVEEAVKTVVEEPQEKIAVATTLESQPKKPVTPEVTVVVVELSEPVAVNVSTDDLTEEEDMSTAKKAGKLWQAIKKAKKSEINLDKDAIVAWVKERNNKN